MCIRSVPPVRLRCPRMSNPGGKMNKSRTVGASALLAILVWSGAAAAGDGPSRRPASITVDPDGRSAYVANLKSNDVSAYRIDPASGMLRPVAGSPFATGTQPIAVAIDSRSRFVYVPNQLSGTLSAYRMDAASGALAPVAGSPFR